MDTQKGDYQIENGRFSRYDSRNASRLESKEMYSTMIPLTITQKTSLEIQKSIVEIEKKNRRRKCYNRNVSLHSTLNPEMANNFSAYTKQYKQSLKNNLPSLKTKRQETKKKMLDQWLNDALSGDHIQKKSEEDSLQNLKRFEIDKKSLINKNLDIEGINKLYSSLFVYSQGIKNSFDEMLAFASNGNNDSQKIIQIYWRAFMKLLESTCSIQTSFQILENQYKRQICDLEKVVRKNKQMFERLDEKNEGKCKLIQRQLDILTKKHLDLEKDYVVTKSTLELTELSFNEEVSLRLKFEEKINSVFRSYNEVKEKYLNLRADFEIKNGSLEDVLQKQRNLERQVLDEQIKNGDLINLLDICKNKLIHQDQILAVKYQEIEDLQTLQYQKFTKEKSEQAFIQEKIQQAKQAKFLAKELNCKIQSFQSIIKSHQDLISKQKQQIKDVRDKNDQLYAKCYASQQQSIPLAQKVQEKQYQINRLKENLSLRICEQEKIEKQLIVLAKTKSEVSQKFENAVKQIHDKNNCIIKNRELIEELKDVKDRVDRKNELLKKQIADMKQHGEKLSETVNSCMKENYELKNDNEENKKVVSMFQRSLNECKQDGLKFKSLYESLVKAKETLAVEKGSLIQRLQASISTLNQENTHLKEIISQKSDHESQDLSRNSFLIQKLESLEVQKKELGQQMERLQRELEITNRSYHQLKDDSQSKTMIINSTKNDVNAEIRSLKVLTEKQRYKIISKQQHIHPMIVEDYVEQIHRYQNKFRQIQQQQEEISEKYQRQQEFLKEKQMTFWKVQLAAKVLEERISALLLEIEDKNSKLIICAENEERNRRNYDEISGRLFEMQIAIGKNTTEFTSRLEEKQNVISGLRQSISQLKQQLISTSKVKNEEKAIKQLAALSQKLICKDKYVQTEEEVESAQNQKLQQISKVEDNVEIFEGELLKQDQVRNLVNLEQEKDNDDAKLSPRLQKEQEGYLSKKVESSDRGEKKVEGKQFKKALRLTYLRR